MSNRDEAYMSILEATASIQFNLSVMLEAKAIESVKARNWVCELMFARMFEDHEDQLKTSIEIHEQIVGVIDGLTKLENGLAKNLKVLLDHGEEGGSGGFGSLFGGQGDDES